MSTLADRFEEIYKAHYKALRNAAENILGDKDAAHDVVQEVFVKVWHRKDELGVILNEKAYLFKSVVNASITYLSQNKHKKELKEYDAGSGSAADSNMMSKELEEKIEQALKTLPPKCKAIFALSRFEGMKNKEIAATLNLSLKTVENQMGIALKKLREDLKPYLGAEAWLAFVWMFLLSFRDLMA